MAHSHPSVDGNEPGAADTDTQGHTPIVAPAVDGPDVQPATAYTIICPDHGIVNLTAQHAHIRKAVRDALPRLQAKLVFELAFPDTITLSRDVNDTLILVARDNNSHTGLKDALRVNTQLSSTLVAIVCVSFGSSPVDPIMLMWHLQVKQRMSTYCGNLKKLADTHVTAYYQLKPGCRARAAFKYRGTSHMGTTVDVFPAMLQAVFFNGGSSIAGRNLELFTSSLDAHPDEKEIPIPMLAFIRIAIHAAIMEWHTGTHTHVSFSANTFLDVYNEHKLLLSGIKAGNACRIHLMMHHLYRNASGTAPKNTDTAVAAANNTLAHVNFANMDVD